MESIDWETILVTKQGIPWLDEPIAEIHNGNKNTEMETDQICPWNALFNFMYLLK